MKKNPKLVYVGDLPGDWNRQKAFSQMQNLITSYPDLKACFVQNEDMALGAIQALKEAGKDQQVAIVSQNGAPYGLESISAGGIKATVGWSPSQEAPACAAHARGVHPRQEGPAEADHHADDRHHEGERQRGHSVGAHGRLHAGDPEDGSLEGRPRAERVDAGKDAGLTEAPGRARIAQPGALLAGDAPGQRSRP